MVGSSESAIDDLTGIQEVYPEDELLDVYESVGDHSQLVIGERGRGRIVNIPFGESISPETLNKTLGGVVVNWDRGGSRPTVPADGITPSPPYPDIVIEIGTSDDFILHPGLLHRRRRKRKRSY